METKFKTYQETAPFVEALQAVLLAEANTLEGFYGIYGEEIPKDGGKSGGEDQFNKSGLSDLFEELKNSLRIWIGTTFELGMSGLLESPGDPALVSKKED